MSDLQTDPITLSREEALEILRQVNLMLISLHQMGSYYQDRDRSSYEKETTRFIDEWKVTQRLSSIRRTITSKFDLVAGLDKMDEVERALEGLKYWSAEGDMPAD
jgi:hypothetical protein